MTSTGEVVQKFLRKFLQGFLQRQSSEVSVKILSEIFPRVLPGNPLEDLSAIAPRVYSEIPREFLQSFL